MKTDKTDAPKSSPLCELDGMVLLCDGTEIAGALEHQTEGEFEDALEPVVRRANQGPAFDAMGKALEKLLYCHGTGTEDYASEETKAWAERAIEDPESHGSWRGETTSAMLNRLAAAEAVAALKLAAEVR